MNFLIRYLCGGLPDQHVCWWCQISCRVAAPPPFPDCAGSRNAINLTVCNSPSLRQYMEVRRQTKGQKQERSGNKAIYNKWWQNWLNLHKIVLRVFVSECKFFSCCASCSTTYSLCVSNLHVCKCVRVCTGGWRGRAMIACNIPLLKNNYSRKSLIQTSLIQTPK